MEKCLSYGDIIFMMKSQMAETKFLSIGAILDKASGGNRVSGPAEIAQIRLEITEMVLRSRLHLTGFAEVHCDANRKKSACLIKVLRSRHLGPSGHLWQTFCIYQQQWKLL